MSAALVANAGTAAVEVLNPNAPLSNPVTFTILASLSITTNSPLPTATVGSFYSVTLQAAGGSPPYSNWLVMDSVLPGGLTLNPSTGVLSGTPTTAGPFNFYIYVNDNAEDSATKSMSLTVAATPPLSIQTPPVLPGGTVGTLYSVTLQASGGTPPYRSWRIVEYSSPLEFTINASTGLLSGTPTTAGSRMLQISVDDSGGQSASRDFSIAVNVPPLAITTTSLPDGIVGSVYSGTLTAIGGQSPYTWSIAAGALPPGLAMNSSSGSITGTPTVSASYSFTVRVTDAMESPVTRSLSININVQPLAITTASLPPATVGVQYSQQFAATGGSGSYVWSVSAGLPVGLTLSPGGLLNGSPSMTGSYPFTVSVADATGTSVPRPFVINVVTAPLTIITSSPLPNGIVGAVYPEQQFTARNGTPPYTWSISAGALTPGLTLSAAGLLTGTPTQRGTFNFTARVQDSLGAFATGALTHIVNIPAPPTPSIGAVPPSPGQQPSVSVQLSSAYALDINGTLTLTFAPDSGLPDDPMIVFPNGTRTLDFTVPAGSTVSSASMQTGTVAGRIDLTITRLVAAGQTILPSPAPLRSIQIPLSAPFITSVQLARTSDGFDVQVRGYSTTRQVTQATFQLTASPQGNLQTNQVTIPVSSPFTSWYGSASSNEFGSTFLYTQRFTVQGDVGAIASVSVTLTNAVGTSQPASVNF